MIAGLTRVFIEIILGTCLWYFTGPLTFEPAWFIPSFCIVFVILFALFDAVFIVNPAFKIKNLFKYPNKVEQSYLKKFRSIIYSADIKYWYLAFLYLVSVFVSSIAYLYILSVLSIECAGNLYNIINMNNLIKTINKNED